MRRLAILAPPARDRLCGSTGTAEPPSIAHDRLIAVRRRVTVVIICSTPIRCRNSAPALRLRQLTAPFTRRSTVGGPTVQLSHAVLPVVNGWFTRRSICYVVGPHTLQRGRVADVPLNGECVRPPRLLPIHPQHQIDCRRTFTSASLPVPAAAQAGEFLSHRTRQLQI